MPHFHRAGVVIPASSLNKFFQCRKGCGHHSLTRPPRDKHESGCRPYERHELVSVKKTGERAAVMSCSLDSVVVMTTRGDIKTLYFDEVGA